MKRLREIWNEIDPEVQVFYKIMFDFVLLFSTLFTFLLIIFYIILSC